MKLYYFILILNILFTYNKAYQITDPVILDLEHEQIRSSEEKITYQNLDNDNYTVGYIKLQTTQRAFQKTQNNEIIEQISDVIIQKSNRPFHAGLGTTRPPRIKPGKPWPARPQDYVNFSVTTLGIQHINKPHSTTVPPKIKPGKPTYLEPEDSSYNRPDIIDRFKETTTQKPNKPIISGSPTLVNNVLDVSKPNRPFFAGSGTTPPPKISPGKPWPTRPEDNINFSVTTNKNPHIVDRYKETTLPIQHINKPHSTTVPPKIKPGQPTHLRPEDSSSPNGPEIIDRFKETTTQKHNNLGSLNKPIFAGSPTLVNNVLDVSRPNRPFFAGSGTTPPPKIPPGKPWPSRPEDYANFNGFPQFDNRFKETTLCHHSTKTTLSHLSDHNAIEIDKPNRPPFAGSGNTSPPKIPPGQPWPSRPEDYANFSITTNQNPQIIDRIKEPNISQQNTVVLSNNASVNNVLDVSKPNRPSKPEDYSNFTVTTNGFPHVNDRFKETTISQQSTTTPISNLLNNNGTQIATPMRPSFAGLGTTSPPKIPPGQPWPSRPEDYVNFSVTTNQNHQILDSIKETNILQQNTVVLSNKTSVNVLDVSKPNRPSFAGSGSTSPPKIPPGTPWPSRPEDYPNFTVTNNGFPQVNDRFKETTIPQQSTTIAISNLINNNSIQIATTMRPSFAGLGTTLPLKIPPGQPWPSRPEYYANFSVTINQNPQIIDRIKDTNITQQNTAVLSNSTSVNNVLDMSKPNRPFFAGSGTTSPPKIPPGTPWPSRPEDNPNFSVTTNGFPQLNDRFKETTTTQQSTTTSISNLLNNNAVRPSFAGLGTISPPKISPGQPWPAQPEDCANFSITTNQNPQIIDKIKETNISQQNTVVLSNNTSVNNVLNVSKPNRPFFAGSGTTPPPKIPPGTPWPSKPEDYANFTVT